MTLQRPQLAVSAAIFRDGKVLLIRRAREPARGLYTLPGGRVETGESLTDAVAREVREETSLAIEVRDLAGYREILPRDGQPGHFVILPFAARWKGGEVVLNEESDDFRWVTLADLAGLPTTPGLAEIVRAAFTQLI
jgi:ADP-ribose pyrophosphatase YjhB (NUDIX family)